MPHFPTDPAAACNALIAWLSEHPEIHTIAVFSALPGEVDLSLLVHHHPEKRWVYPLVRQDTLTFHAVTDPATDLKPGSFGVREPSPTLEEIPIAQIDAFLCPGLAFDENGGRLGRGRGFYDRILAHARPTAVKIGVCFPSQRVADTFSEPHDVQMDLVIS